MPNSFRKQLEKYPQKREHLIQQRNHNRALNYKNGNFRKDNIRRGFTLIECELIVNKKHTDRELAQMLRRSVDSIQRKRCHLKSGIQQLKDTSSYNLKFKNEI